MLFTEEEAVRAWGATITTPLRSNYQAYWLVRATCPPPPTHTHNYICRQKHKIKGFSLTYMRSAQAQTNTFIHSFCLFNEETVSRITFGLFEQNRLRTQTHKPGTMTHSVIYLLTPTQPAHSGWTKTLWTFSAPDVKLPFCSREWFGLKQIYCEFSLIHTGSKLDIQIHSPKGFNKGCRRISVFPLWGV